jgi:NAD(P)-dependent dehydrogenase (short-subunit alcohol dehydrogenase family)
MVKSMKSSNINSRHRNRIVIVGASSGIGYNIVKRLSEENVDLVIVSRQIEKLEMIKNELGSHIETYQLDATIEDEVEIFSNKIGKFDHLISTLRGSNVKDKITASKTSEVRKAFDEKFWSQYNLVRHLIKNINKNGSIILTSGIASQRSYPNYYWLASANAAIESLVKSLSLEIAPIRINAVSPGFVESKVKDTVRLEAIKSIEPKLPMSRLATQPEIVEAYLYLMKSTYSTGTVLVIDGGVLCA